MTLKVCYILRHFPLPSETFVINEILSLQKLGVQIYPVSMFEPVPCHESLMSELGNKVYDIAGIDRRQAAEKSPFLSQARQLARKYEVSEWYAEFAACVADYATRIHVQMLHAHFATESALTAMLVSEITGIPFSFTAHAYDIFIQNDGAPGENLEPRLNLLLSRAARVFTISDFNKRHILGRTSDEHAEKITVIHCGITPDRFPYVARCGTDTVKFLCVGRFVEKKGHEFLIRSFRKVLESYPNATVTLIGEGALKPQIIDLCQTLGVQDSVEFLGTCSSDVVTKEMKKADVFALHSVTAANGDMEGIPVSLMEASATGLPVITTDHSGISELVIDGVTGLVSKERDIEAFSECMARLCESEVLRRKLGDAGALEVNERFNEAVEVTKLEAAFREIVSSSDAEKADAEMEFWRNRKQIEGTLKNGHYAHFFTTHFGFTESSYSGKKMLDIGCGPRGSLEWATAADTRIGLDPLADSYLELGTDKHSTKYAAAHAEEIPFPDGFFDVVSSFNSLDHVEDLDQCIAEIKRVLKPGGTFLLLTEVNHQPTKCEPICYSWDIVDKFTDAFSLVTSHHYERTRNGLYDSIHDNVDYDHSSAADRIGILSAMFRKGSISATSATSDMPRVSVVVPMLDAAETLKLCLDALVRLEYPRELLEIIIVDNGSTDGSLEIAKGYDVMLLLEGSVKGSYAARNKGILAAKGDLIAFTDADCIVTPAWLKNLVSQWHDTRVGCFAGEIEAYSPLTIIEKFSDRAGILRQSGTLTCPYLPYTQTANSAYRRSVFEKVGLFVPEMTSGGDADISWRMQKQMGLQILFIPEALVYHKHRTSLDNLYTQFRKYEFGKSSWQEHYPDYQQPSLANRRDELNSRVRHIQGNLDRTVDDFLEEKIDVVDLFSPFLWLVIAAATCKARAEICSSSDSPETSPSNNVVPLDGPRVSIVICTHNRAELLRQSITAVCNQDFPGEYEVVVVDNNSSDHTRPMTEDLAAASQIPIRYLFEGQQGLSFARNTGIENAKAGIIAFIDDDIDAETGWLSAIVAAFADADVACAGGPIRPIWPSERPDWLTNDWVPYLTVNEFDAARKTGAFVWPDTPWGANIAFRKSVFASIGLFPTNLGRIGSSLLSNEEVNICKKIAEAGMRIAFAPEAVIHHKIDAQRVTKQWFYHRTYWQGRSDAILDATSERGGYDGIAQRLRRCLDVAAREGSGSFTARCARKIALGYLFETAFAADDQKSAPALRVLNHYLDQLETVPTQGAASTSFPDGASSLVGKSILVVDYEVPQFDKYAGSRTTFMYLKLLTELGMKVYFLPDDFEKREPYSSALEALGVTLLQGEWYRDNWQRWVVEHASDLRYVLFNRPNITVSYIDFVKTHTDSTILFQGHDLHYLRLSRKYEFDGDAETLKEAEEYKKIEFAIIQKSHATLTYSDHERQILADLLPQEKIHSVPLFFYESFPAGYQSFAGRKDIMFVGGCGHKPNLDAILWFAREIFPKVLVEVPDMVLHVIGTNPPQKVKDLESANIRIRGHVSEQELEEYYRRIRMVVIPLRFGAGVKGKTVEALRNGVPMVSTTIGLEGIPGIGTVSKPADGADEFASAVVALYRDEKGLELASALYREFAKATFSSRGAKRALAEILLSVPPKERVSAPKPAQGPTKPRLIAMYLPQYHPIAENDEWWGKGFTEWRNVSKAKPLFKGHYQPHIPADLGFYDLRLEETRIAQAELARQYGVDGFCYYHYWFNGKRLLERPLEEVLRSGKPDFPFCVCWANENWTRRWDGEEQHVLMKQVYSEEDDRNHIRDLFRFFQDRRYIRVNGKPMFLVYRTENLPHPRRTAEIWREEARAAGLGELYLVRVESIGSCDPASIGFDSALEFAPDWLKKGPRVMPEQESKLPGLNLLNEAYKSNNIHYYDKLADEMMAKPAVAYKRFRCTTPSWDNSARRQEGANIFVGSTPEKYRQWLKHVVSYTREQFEGDEQIAFINAWNEWAEGNHLEPDQKFGRAYLEATRSAADDVYEVPSQPAVQQVDLSAYKQELLTLQQQLAAARKEKEELQRAAAELKEKLTEQDDVVAARNARIEDLLQSASWRVTEPLRKAYEVAQKMQGKK